MSDSKSTQYRSGYALVNGKAKLLAECLQNWERPDSNWNRAAFDPGHVDPFCCRTEWQLSFHEGMEPANFIVRETPGSAAIFNKLHYSEGQQYFGPVESHWMFGCPLLGAESMDLLQELMAELEPRDTTENIFLISGLEPKGLLYNGLVRRFASSCDFGQGREEIQCSASLDGGLDGYLSRRSSKHRRSLRKQMNKAKRAGVYFERHKPSSPEQAAAIYARMLAVEESSWKGINRCGMTVGRSRKYYDVMLRRLALSGNGRVMFARHEDRDIGFIFGGLAGCFYRGQQFSFADDWKSFSIGNLLQLEQITWLCEEGVQRYDMGPLMEYKTHWTEIMTPLLTLMLRPRYNATLPLF